jgi:hypothetical protein
VKRWFGALAVAVAMLMSTLAVPAPASGREWSWTLHPGSAFLSWRDRFDGSVIYDQNIQVEGYYDNDDRLHMIISETGGPDGWSRFYIDLEASSAWFSRPAGADTERMNSPVSFDVTTSLGCNDLSSRVDVHDLVRDENGRVVRMWFDFDTWCDGGPIHGYVRWGFPASLVEPTDYSFAPTAVGYWSDPVWFRVAATDPPSGAVGFHVDGPNAGDFRVLSVSCTGDGVPPCRLLVDFEPSGSGYRRATLTVEQGGQVTHAPLDGTGLPGTSSAVINGQVMTEDAALFEIGYAYNGTDHVNMRVYPSSGGGYDLEFSSAAGQHFNVGTTYVTGSDPSGGPTVYLSHAADNDSSWIGGNATGSFTFRQLSRPNVDPPAIVADFDLVGANSVEYSGTVGFLARRDVVAPAPPSGVRLSASGVLSWAKSSDAVVTVVRARRGGLASKEVRDGEAVYAGPGTRVAIPGRFRGRATSYSLFTFDATGNVSTARVYVARGAQAVTFRRSASTTVKGAPVNLQGSVIDAGWRYRLANRVVVLQRRGSAGNWRAISKQRTNWIGRYSFRVWPVVSRQYRVVTPLAATHWAAVSAVRWVWVK